LKANSEHKAKRKPHNTKNKSSLTDVAKYAQVSTATVSRCFSHPDKVSPKLKAIVQAAVSELGYTPSGVARALRSSQTYTIGVVVPTLDIAGFASSVQALQARLIQANYLPLLATSNFDKQQELKHVQNLVLRGVDAVMLVGLDHDPSLYTLLEKSDVPFINIWSYQQDSLYPCIGFDNFAAMQKVTDYVIDMGHREIALIVGGKQQINDRSLRRIAGFTASVNARNLPLKIVEASYGISGGRDALRHLLACKNKPTAVVCASDILAIGALKECTKLGIDVPTEMSITGLDDLEISANYSPALTTVHIPTKRMGKLAAEYILARLSGEDVLTHVELDTNLIVRDTVAKFV
jgi:LacI family transcriptional regulator